MDKKIVKSVTTPVVKPLIDMPYERVSWSGEFSYPELHRIRTIMDGNCFFHAIVMAFFIPYIEGVMDGKVFDRREFVTKFRNSLANRLEQHIDILDKSSPTHYETISRGELPDMAKTYDKYSMVSMQRELRSSSPVDNMYNELISDTLSKDIYILDLEKHDVYVTGDDDDILYKGRNSIVIGAMNGHYELMGVMRDGKLKTLFSPEHPLIERIQSRIRTIRLTKNI